MHYAPHYAHTGSLPGYPSFGTNGLATLPQPQTGASMEEVKAWLSKNKYYVGGGALLALAIAGYKFGWFE